MLSNRGFVILSVLKPEYQSLYAKYETPKNIEEAEIGGLGIYLTKELADELEYQYENDENHLIIIKNVE